MWSQPFALPASFLLRVDPMRWQHWVASGLGAVAGWLFGLGSLSAETLHWHHDRQGLVAVWNFAPGTTNLASHALTVSQPPGPWELAGSADFNRDGHLDMLWRQVSGDGGQLAIWYMRGTNRLGTRLLNRSEQDPNWRVRTVGDCDRDGYPDLVWRHERLGALAVWYLAGHRVIRSQLIESPGDTAEGLDWDLVASGDLGGLGGGPDGKLDLIFRQRTNALGLNAVWFMDLALQTNRLRSVLLPPNPVPDWEIVGCGHFNNDGRPDLVWRHNTLGLNAVWFLDGLRHGGATQLAPVLDPYWRLAGQRYAESRWMLSGTLPRLSATPRADPRGPDHLQLDVHLPAIGTPEVWLQRRLLSDTNWLTLAQGPGLSNFIDTVTPGVPYEYRAFRGPPAHRYPRFTLTAGIDLPAVEQRGRVLLVVDETLAGALDGQVRQLQADLVGDGWSIVRTNAPRHNDSFWAANTNGIARLKEWIAGWSGPGCAATQVVFLVGHVVIPYSGFSPTDGHIDHQGAWPSDAYYGDLRSTWTDQSSNLFSQLYPETRNEPGDGRFDQDFLNQPLAMGVGRVDFSNLPALPVGELELLKRYLAKSHRYRHRQLPWQAEFPLGIPPRVMAYNHFGGHLFSLNDMGLSGATRHASAWFGPDPALVSVGDILLRRDLPVAASFLSAAGSPDRINAGEPNIETSTASLALASPEPPAVFFQFRSSYMGDWNFRRNNFLRALTALPHYGLAAVWKNIGYWRFDGLALGQHLGAGMVRMMDRTTDYYLVGDTHRDLTILGDPTLRLHPISPPGEVQAEREGAHVRIQWSVPTGAEGCYVYWSPRRNGPFERRLMVTAGATTLAIHTNAPSGFLIYLVRTAVKVTSGSGSYTNLSQGAYSNVVPPRQGLASPEDRQPENLN
jgi:hypothetical protein